MEIYIVVSRNNRIKDFTSVGVSQECYKTKEQAIKFCKSRLNKEELEEDTKMKNRNLKNWYEFDSRTCHYEIKILNLK